MVENLIFIRGCSPSGGIPGQGEQIFYSVGNAVQRAPVAAGCDFRICLPGLLQGVFFQEGDHGEQRWIVAAHAPYEQAGERF